MTPKPVVLCILDGWGLNNSVIANAVLQANTPTYDHLQQKYPMAELRTDGSFVGLPDGQMGNSEVGHMNIGAGRVVWMDLPKINNAIEKNLLAENAALVTFIQKLQQTDGTAHLMGLISPGGVHAHQNHVVALAQILSQAGVKVKIHAFLDGRDTPPSSAREYMKTFSAQISGLESVEVATMSGRFYAMDRDNRWERVKLAYDAMMFAQGCQAQSVEEAFLSAEKNDETDEFIKPTVLPNHTPISENDGLLMANFRADRAREILSALADPNFQSFDVSNRPKLTACLGMVEYSTKHSEFMDAIFPQTEIKNTLGQWVSHHGKTQLRLAETEKYPHVTFFMNGGVEEPYAGEDRKMSPSPKVKTYDLKPEMAAEDVCINLVEAITAKKHDLIIVNFANPDMVGHTGKLDAAIKAVETVDTAVGQALTAIKNVKGAMIVTADHGNCELMVDPISGAPHTAHTTNPVPVFLIDESQPQQKIRSGALCDLAPTLLELMNLPQPSDMEGVSLIEK
jgi:2,3-bisphosphoglycerate-independent phosphoglycerate mutase